MPNIGIDQGFYEPSTGLSTNQLAFGTDKGNFFQNVTDAFGLTDYRKQNKAWEGAQDALGFQLGLSKDLASWYDKVIRPRQEQTLGRLGEYYDDASFSDEDYARTLGAASEDVAKSYGRARDATGRQLMSAGLDPSSGRYQSIISGFGRNQAATEAEARNAARAGLRDTEFARKGAALGLTGQSLSSMNPVGLSMSGAGQVGGIQSGLFSNLFGTNTGMMRRQQEDILGAAKSFLGGAMGGGMGFADGKEVKTKRYANGKRAKGLSLRRERFMGDAERVDVPVGLSQIEGEVRGPGTPVSDSISVPAEGGGRAGLADGEVVMPTDSVAAIGLSAMRTNPEAAMHKLGVAILEEQIDQTHVPAELQKASGLSVDPRGVEKQYADGGQTGGFDWRAGLLNWATNGGLGDMRDRQLRQEALNEELDFKRQQHQRQMDEWKRQDEFRTAAGQAIADASQYQDPAQALDDPEFGVTAQTGDQSMVRGLRLAQPDMERARPALLGLQAKYKPDQYLASLSAANEKKAASDWEREKLDIQHKNKLDQIRTEERIRAKSGGGSAAPADVRTAEWMVQRGIAKTPDEAWSKVRMARLDPAKAVADIAKGMADEQKASYLTKDDPEYRSYGQMVEEAKGIVRGILDSYSGGKIEPTPANSAAATTLKKSYTHPSGKAVTLESIRETAKKRGLTEEEVIKRLGLQ